MSSQNWGLGDAATYALAQVDHATLYSWLRMYRPIRHGCAFE
jgi:hypothetical protein